MTLIIIVVSVLTATTIILAVKLVRRPKQPPEQISTKPSDNSKPTPITTKVKQRPIDKVIDFINENMENVGYKDAQTNNNENFENEKIAELRERGKQICGLAIIEYREKIAEIEVKIKECDKTGLFETKEKLESQKKIFENQYIKEIEKINNEIEDDNKFKEKTVFSSYRRGFAKWRKASAEGLIEDKEDMKGGV
jgi:hypothetical protein